MAEDFQYRRAPAKYRRIAEINPEKDIRVRILGRIISRKEDSVTVDDGSASADVILDETKAPDADIVRVFARVMPLEDGYELKAEIIQDMSSIDMDLYRKVMKASGQAQG